MLELTPELAATCNRPVVDRGPPPDRVFLSDDNYEEIAARLIAENGTRPLWVFAYGSLLWCPAGTVVESRWATAPGWQRSFCLEIRHWRGSPSDPGLMLGLVQGHGCDGMVQRLPDDRQQDELVKLLAARSRSRRGPCQRPLDRCFNADRSDPRSCLLGRPPRSSRIKPVADQLRF